MNEQLRLLVKLQGTDSIILSIADKIEALPERLMRFKLPFKEATSNLEKVKAKYEELNKKKKTREQALEDIEAGIKKSKERTKDIKTNKEYEAHLKEIEASEKNKYQVEEDIISIMEALDSITKEMEEEKSKVKKVEESLKEKEKRLDEEKKTLHSEMDAYKTKRKELARELNEELYEKYMLLMKSKGGVAVARTKDEVCLGCHTNIPPQLYNDIKSDQNIYTCCYCERFLYYKASEENN